MKQDHIKKLLRDLHDPHEMTRAPRGMQQTTRQTGHQEETGAPKGRGPDGQLIGKRD